MLADVIPLTRTPPGLDIFTYQANSLVAKDLTPGILVRVPFRKTNILGVYLGPSNLEAKTIKNIKEIIAVVGTGPIIPAPLLTLATELCAIHRASVSGFIKNLVPPLGPRNLKKITPLLAPLKTKQSAFSDIKYLTVNSQDELKKILDKSAPSTGQNLFLVPENQYLKIIKSTVSTKKKVVLFSSQSSTLDFWSLWKKIRSDEPVTVVATRAALFLPWTNLKIIAVIDEGNPSYKSFDLAPRYHTAVVAQRLAKLTGAALKFLSHTPSVNAHQNYSGKVLARRQTQVVDMQQERMGGNKSVLSQDLDNALTQNTGHALMLLNRKGSLTAVSCRDCNYVFRCLNCGRSQVYFQSNATLRCLYCQISAPFQGTCPKCLGANLKMTGVGTELLEKGLKQKSWADRYTIVRLDSDTPAVLPASQKPYLVIGTAQAFQTLPINSFSLVALIDADTPLYVPEYTAAEDLWQLIGSINFWLPQNSNFFIQTKQVEHPVFAHLYNPAQFYQTEIAARRLLKFPPFCQLLKIYSTGPDNQLKASAAAIYDKLKQLTASYKMATIDQPRPAYPERWQGQLRLVIIARLPLNFTLKDGIKLIASLPANWKVDWNPATLLSI